jgi:hypothetical protein
MLLRFLAAFQQEFVELAGFLAFLVEADYRFYGVAAAFELAFLYPAAISSSVFSDSLS